MDVRIDQPGKDGRYAAAQSQELDLNIHPVLRLHIPRVKVQSPQKSAVVAHREFAFVFFSGISHLCDAHRSRKRVNMRGVALGELNIELRVVDGGDDGVPVKWKVHAEMLSVTAKQFGALHVRFEKFSVMRVVLSYLKHLFEPGLGNKSDGKPLMDQPVRNIDLLSVIPRIQRSDVNLASLQACDLFFSLRLGKGIDVQELARSGKFAPYPGFGQLFVMLKRLHGTRFQFRRTGFSGVQHRKKNQTQGKRTAGPGHIHSGEPICPQVG